ncbi:hypothetical protein AJ80_05294 [Polytolypa hystricis UAMH7299]|uniref:Cysteine protease n=1 Tax=Polytolypa hystricis (strain UAMH7299) TaxID=1447883 RepID=A0A2B7Y4L5_POLH7|nr:hypothetical protein AJ80_05294 [Polytolypa hystricis UAMH7299]
MNNVDIEKCKRFVQNLWDPEPKNDEEPGLSIWCLGQEYPQSIDLQSSSSDGAKDLESPVLVESNNPQLDGSKLGAVYNDHQPTESDTAPSSWPGAFVRDFESKIWLTYRSDFPIIPKSKNPNAASSMTLGVRLRSQLMDSHGFTADTGWGCMIRSGQSLLANALALLFLGREWRRGTQAEEESRLLSLFADDPRAPFSIHKFVAHGASACGKYPGEWFGPSATAACIEALSSECKEAGLNVYVTSDGSDVYEDRFRQIACGDTNIIRPTLILLGIRLGIDRITPVYWEALKSVLKCPQSVGIAGGRPSSSHYFVGVQGSHFFYLDPHHTRPAIPYRESSSMLPPEELDSYHTRRLRRLHVREMDPSMLVGFLIKDEDDWLSWKQSVRSVDGKAIFHIFDHETSPYRFGSEREAAVDEVEALDDDLQGDGPELSS